MIDISMDGVHQVAMTNTPLLPSQSASETSGLAIGSMVCGILGFLTFGLSGWVGVALGHIALSQIKKSGGRLTGGGFAVTGLITGYFSGLIMIVAALVGLSAPMILRQRDAAERTVMISNMKQLHLALLEFDQEFGSFPSDATADAVADATGLDAGRLTGADVFKQFEVLGIGEVDDLLSVNSRAEGGWIYFPGHKVSDANLDQVILISPTIRGEAVVLELDGGIERAKGPKVGELRTSPDAVEIPAPRR